MPDTKGPLAQFKIIRFSSSNYTGWLEFIFPDDVPAEFIAWCRAQQGARNVEGPNATLLRPSRRALVFLDTFAGEAVTRATIRRMIAEAGAAFGYDFTIEDLGVHVPARESPGCERPPEEDRHLTNLALRQQYREPMRHRLLWYVLTPLYRVMSQSIRHWKSYLTWRQGRRRR